MIGGRFRRARIFASSKLSPAPIGRNSPPRSPVKPSSLLSCSRAKCRQRSSNHSRARACPYSRKGCAIWRPTALSWLVEPVYPTLGDQTIAGHTTDPPSSGLRRLKAG